MKQNIKRNWIWILIVMIVIGIILYFSIRNLFSAKVAEWSISELLNNIERAKENTTDTLYFKEITVNPFTNSITGVFNNTDNTSTSFVTYTNLDLLRLSGVASDQGVISKIFTPEVFLTANNVSGSLKSVATPQPNPFLGILVSSVPVLILIFVMVWIYRSQAKMMNGQGGAFGGDKGTAQIIKSDKKFTDIAGNKEPIEEISEVVDYLKNPGKYQQSGARMPHGILLGGPPGTGKTLLAKATAGEANVPFYFVSASSFVELFVGMGAKRVRQVISEARKNSPAIIFIDELDAIGRTRGSGIGGGHDEREQTLNQLLVEMDGMKENSGLLFIAATNRTDVLDPALIRPGRFDRIITVGLPDVKEREEILKLHAKGKRFESNVDFANIAKRTPGFSGAQLENVINEAVLLSIREDTKVINLYQIDEAIDRVMSGPAKKSRTITKEELTMVAYHEAGHAVVGIKVPGGNKVQKITIIPRGNAGGYNLMMPENEKYNYSKADLYATIASFMGGRAAEEIIYGDNKISTGAADDIKKATSIARRMVTQFGMSDLGPIEYQSDEGSPFLGKALASNSSLSNQVNHEIELEIRKIIFTAKEQATKIIKQNIELLELIKESLLKKETIVGEEIEYIAKHMKLPPEKTEEKDLSKNSEDNNLDSLIEKTSKKE